VGLGLFQFQQRRTPDHAKLPVGAAAADLKTVSDLAI
jgi:hypothetical protein